MGRRPKGSLYVSDGTTYLSLTLDKRRSFRLTACKTMSEAELRQTIIVEMASKLRSTGHLDVAIRFCREAGEADEATLGKLIALMNGIVAGRETPVPVGVTSSTLGSAKMTVRQFGETLWTNNDLARRFRGRVKRIDHAENIRKLNKHVYPIEFRGRTIGDTPLDEFTLDHADHVLAQPSLPKRSVRHVAQCMHPLLKLAVYPARIVPKTPFPLGWLPTANPVKEGSFLYPSEDEALMAETTMPLVKRLLIGFCAREGLRKTNAATLQWSNLSLDLPNGAGHIVLDKTKNGRGGSWALDAGTAEALRRWHRSCPSDRWVFPAKALPRSRNTSRLKFLNVDHIARDLRDGLLAAGVTREKLFEQNDNRLRLRAHDLRATFVTLALANGRTEDWVRTRTGHGSSQMIARYRREAQTAVELKLDWLKPLHLALPELREMGDRPKLKLVGGTDMGAR